MRVEPPLSLPIEPATSRAATAAADPPDDPPAQRARSCGLRAGPQIEARPVVPMPSSCCWATPTTTAPASRSRANTPDAPGGSSSRDVPPCAPRHGVREHVLQRQRHAAQRPVAAPRRASRAPRRRTPPASSSARRRARRSAPASRRAARRRRASRRRPPAPARAGRGPGDGSWRPRGVERGLGIEVAQVDGVERRAWSGRTSPRRSAAGRGRPRPAAPPGCGERTRRVFVEPLHGPTLPSHFELVHDLGRRATGVVHGQRDLVGLRLPVRVRSAAALAPLAVAEAPHIGLDRAAGLEALGGVERDPVAAARLLRLDRELRERLERDLRARLRAGLRAGLRGQAAGQECRPACPAARAFGSAGCRLPLA